MGQFDPIEPQPEEPADKDGPTTVDDRGIVTFHRGERDVAVSDRLVEKYYGYGFLGGCVVAGIIGFGLMAWIASYEPDAGTRYLLIGVGIAVACSLFGLNHMRMGLHADADGVRLVKLLHTTRISWSDLDHLALVPHPDHEEVGHLAFVTRTGRVVNALELAGDMDPDSSVFELGETLIAMRDRYAPPGSTTVTSDIAKSRPPLP